MTNYTVTDTPLGRLHQAEYATRSGATQQVAVYAREGETDAAALARLQQMEQDYWAKRPDFERNGDEFEKS